MKKEHKELFNKLTRLEKGVCLNLLKGNKYEKAYFDAGGLAKSPEAARAITSRMLTNDNVKAFMEAVDGDAVDDAIMTKIEAMKRLSVLAKGNVSDLVNFSTVELEDGSQQSVWALKNQDDMDEEQLSLISELSAGKDGFKFKVHSSTQAVAQLSKMAGWDAPAKVATTDSEGNDVDLDAMAKARTILLALDLVSRQGTSNSNSTDKEES